MTMHTNFPLPFSMYEWIFLDEPLRAREDGAFMHICFLNQQRIWPPTLRSPKLSKEETEIQRD